MTKPSLKDKAGAIFVLTLWVIALLSLLALSLNARVRLHSRAQRWLVVQAESKEMVLTGVQTVYRRYAQDDAPEYDAYSEESMKSLVLSSADLNLPTENPNGQDPFELTLSVIDESGKVNVNAAGESLLREILVEAGGEENAADIAAAIIDWRDADDIGFAEATLYAGREPAYSPPNLDLAHLQELLYISGVTLELYFGEDANMNGVLDRSEDDGGDTYPPDNMDGRLQLGLRDMLTVHGTGEVNVNTAPSSVLRGIFRDSGLTEYEADKLAKSLIEQRDGLDRLPGSSDDKPFTSAESVLSGITDVLGENGQAQALAILQHTGTRSQAARCRAVIRWPLRHSRFASELLVVRDGNDTKAIEWQDL